MEHRVRVQEADRRQFRLEVLDLDGLVSAEHRVRVVWRFVEQLDLAGLYAGIRAIAGSAGRPAIDPKILLALWLYATLEGIGSARAVARLCEQHNAYRWLCGGVGVNYHALADFRHEQAAAIDDLLSQCVAALAACGVVELDEAAVDGLKVRASAGVGSFRGAAGTTALLAAAQARVARLKTELAADPAASEKRRLQAATRAAEAVAERATAALQRLQALQQDRTRQAKRHKKEVAAKGEPKASSTDPQARTMRMPDGGFRPAYNCQLAVDPGSGVILGVAVADRHNDYGLALPMVRQLTGRYGRPPRDLLADGGFAHSGDVLDLAAAGVRLTCPAPQPRPGSKPLSRNRWRRRALRAPALAEWRTRMATAAAQTYYRRRMAVETVNACLRNRGLTRVLVRGLDKVRAVLLLHALAHNLLRAHKLLA